MAARVVVFQEPVGHVTRINPCHTFVTFSYISGNHKSFILGI